MIFYVLACDYDGTLALNGRIDENTAAALERVKRSGRKLMMVTGRELPDLRKTCQYLDMFDLIVAENGALLYLPQKREERLICEPANPHLVKALQQRGVDSISVGKGIIATWEQYKEIVLDTIQDLGLEEAVIFNKGAVMILPTSINKGTGLKAGLLELGFSRHNTVGIGDAENDHAFLSQCGFSVAVSNALPALKERADYVTKADHGTGVTEFIDEHLLSDLNKLTYRLAERHKIVLGKTIDHQELSIPAHRTALLITGGSGSGKFTLTGVLVERLIEDERIVCIIDPEGDYAPLVEMGKILVMGGGDDKPLPSQDELAQMLIMPETSVVLNLHALSLPEKTSYVASVLGTIERARAESGRPHWLIIDEVHHMMPAEGSMVADILPNNNDALYEGLCMITFDANLLSVPARKLVKRIATRTIEELGIAARTVLEAQQLDKDISALDPEKMAAITEDQSAIINLEDDPIVASYFQVDKRRTTHRRHIRKYATGELPEERSFFFRGAENKLNLRAANLIRFSELAEGVDDETWLFHLKQGDYSHWMREMIKNDELADEVTDIEKHSSNDRQVEPSRSAVINAINKRYTA